MKTTQVSMWMAGVLLLAGMANADIVAIQHTMNYEDNSWADGVWFIPSGAILDHADYCRACNQDWAWTHVVTDRIPAGATGIESATLTVIAWKIDVEAGEDDYVYALAEEPATTALARTNGANLGMLNSASTSPTTVSWAAEDEYGASQINGYEYLWSTTTFELPAETLEELWANGQVCFYLDIDQTSITGMRATIESATLRINYIAPTPQAPPLVDVHRFWSPVLTSHFYTASVDEVNTVIANYPDVWTYEAVAYRAMADETDSMAVPVYRFWSPILTGHFYTADESEANHVIATYVGIWDYEGVVFYAYPADYQPANTHPVHRFWSPLYGHHFYTISEAEKELVIATYAGIWNYECIAWNAFLPEESQ